VTPDLIFDPFLEEHQFYIDNLLGPRVREDDGEEKRNLLERRYHEVFSFWRSYC